MAKTTEVETGGTPIGGVHQAPFLDPSSSCDHDNGTPAGNPAGMTPASGKRTPSTTHPYQMSEAFANRHHHCERVDGLNRGIWTSFGPGGTQDRPTGPTEEMYLRCNHDDCRRIDWRTVHGLQCHIVKNHEQPKGTIGSLEKALDRYGVPIREVEEYEREHGEGTGGTMADPKNLKIKNKTKDAVNRKSTPGSYGMDPTARPAGYKPTPPGVRDSPTIPSSMPRTLSGNVIRRTYVQEESTHSDTDDSGSVQEELRKSGPGVPKKSAPTSKLHWEAEPFRAAVDTLSGSPQGQTKRAGPAPRKSGPPFMSDRYETVRGEWPPGSRYMTGPPPAIIDPNRQLQGDAVMKDVPPMSTWKHWSPADQTSDGMASSRSVSNQQSLYTGSKDSTPRPPAASLDAVAAPPTQSGLPSTQSQAMAEQIKKVEDKHAKADSTFVAPQVADSQIANAQMSDVSDSQRPEPNSSKALVGRDSEKKEDDERPKETAPDIPNRPEEVDGEKCVENANTTAKIEIQTSPTVVEGPARGTRSALQSPIQTNKPFNPPMSAKRVSRRSSIARKLSRDSPDGCTEVEKKAEGVAGEETEQEKGKDGSAKGLSADEEVDGDSITVATGTAEMRKAKDEASRESLKDREAKTTPKRNANGRFTRKKTLS